VTWTRLDDGWTDDPTLAQLSYPARWHYLALVQFCSRTGRYDGVVGRADARRCSDVEDPAACLAELDAAGLSVPVTLVVTRDRGYALTRIAQHVPPPHLRDEARKPAQAARQRRSRARKQQSPVTSRDVSRVTPGRDGTGRDGTLMGPTPDAADAWPEVTPPGSGDPVHQQAARDRMAARRREWDAVR